MRLASRSWAAKRSLQCKDFRLLHNLNDDMFSDGACTFIMTLPMQLPRKIMQLFFAATLALAWFSTAHAHTTDLSSSQITIVQNGVYNVKVTVSQIDVDRMFEMNKDLIASQKTRLPGFLETLMGQFLQARIALENANGIPCPSEIVRVDDDPHNSDILTAHLRFDCSKVEGPI